MIKAQNTRTVRCQFAFTDADGNRQEETIRVHYRLSAKTREAMRADKDLTALKSAVMVVTGLPDLTDENDLPVKPTLELFESMDADNFDRIQTALAEDFSPNATSATPSSAGSLPVEEVNPQTITT